MASPTTAEAQYQLLTHPTPGLPFIFEHNFLSAADCDELIACFNRNKHLAPGGSDTDQFFQDRFLWMPDLPLTELRAKSIMQSSRDRCARHVQQFFGEATPLYADTVQLVRWSKGEYMPAHADNAEPDGSPHRTPYRKYASVIYLNDDYVGGEIYIVPLRVKIKPQKGSYIGFKGDFSHEHGVMHVQEGTRYTMPMWFSLDPAHKEREYAIDYCSLWEQSQK